MRVLSGVLLSFFAAPALASGPTFKVIAVIPGAPAIGGLIGTTLYGTLPAGGANGAGEFFSLSVAGAYRDLHDFVSGTDGGSPNARLAISPNRTIWGTAQSGGLYGGGTIFTWTSTGFSVAHHFGDGGDGVMPLQGPVRGPANSVYGTAAGGAVNTNGNLWHLGATGYTVLHDFLSQDDGHCPFSGPYWSPSGMVYGTTIGRGFGGDPNGSVWAAKGKQVTTLYSFQNGSDGEWPDQSPVTDAAGNVYGTTHVQNGTDFAGAVWTISPSSGFSVLHAMDGPTEGFAPNSPLVLNVDGYLYGTTASGGAANAGTVFRLRPSGADFSVVHSFSGGSDGANPTGNLIHDGTGAIYGGTAAGTVFKISY